MFVKVFSNPSQFMIRYSPLQKIMEVIYPPLLAGIDITSHKSKNMYHEVYFFPFYQAVEKTIT